MTAEPRHGHESIQTTVDTYGHLLPDVTIVDFLLARIAEDEVGAKRHAVRAKIEVPGETLVWWERVAARVLAECEAKRRIVAEFTDSNLYTIESEYLEEGVLGALASVYADHPDFRPEWSQ